MQPQMAAERTDGASDTTLDMSRGLAHHYHRAQAAAANAVLGEIGSTSKSAERPVLNPKR